MTLRLTHLSQRRDIYFGLDDGWYIRFTGDGDEWDDMRQELKDWGRDFARWLPEYEWDDYRKGAWWVDEGLFLDTYRDRFSNLRFSMLEATDETVQWLYKGRRGWEGSRPSRYRQQERTYTKQESARCIPVHLKDEYALLGVGATATLKDVKNAYRRLSKRAHPDAGGTHLAFIALVTAYERVKQWVEMVEGRTA